MTSRFGKYKLSILLIVIAALLIEMTSATMYWYARRGIREEVQHRAEAELKVKSLEIEKVMTAVESAVSNTIWAAEARLSQPDSLYQVLGRMVRQNSAIVGAGLMFTANYYPKKGRWFEPYVAERADSTLEMLQIGNADHDYLKASWFRDAMIAGNGYWSDPYYDEAGAKMMLCSYFIPIRDASGYTVALMGADISLDWLSDVINAQHVYPSSYNIMISRTGKLMACPVESLIMQRTIQEMTARIEDTTSNYVNNQMMAGRRGHASLTDENGQKNYIFYAPVENASGWSMAVVCSDREIYYGLRKVGFNLLLMMFAGLALMSYIIWRMIRNTRTLFHVENRKAVMDKELNIARSIQQALLPKTFPPFPERNDIDVLAMLTPAREVGGDLYDFFIRDEKLFFCIGDVSGKGMPAAIIMAITRTLFRNAATHESKPSRILTAINDTFSAENPDDYFVTLLVGVLDLPSGRLYYSSAGHDAPILITADKKEALPVEANLPIGSLPGWAFVQQSTVLPDEASLFLYTDGLTEAMNAGKELFGKKNMMETLKESTPQEMIETMVNNVDTFVNGAEQSDDLTMLAVHYSRPKKTVRLNRSITLPNDIQAVPELNGFVEDVCKELGFDLGQTMKMNLAVEEATVNVMNYAYPQGIAGKVLVEAQADNELLKFIITDSGMPFDPTEKPEVDTTLPLEERPIGGLGIHLVRHYMDSINYERTDNKNVFTLICKLKKA